MPCPHCGQNHPSNARFCTVTGLEIPPTVVTCPHCGKPVQAVVNFCPYCAAPLSTAVPPTPRQRRPLFLAIAGLLIILLLGAAAWWFLRDPAQPFNPIAGLFDRTRPSATPVDVGVILASTTPLTSQTPILQAETAIQEAPTETASPTATPTPIPSLTATLLPSPTLIPSPTPTPNLALRGWIAYAYGEDNKREIFLLNPDTAAVVQLTYNDYTDEAPSFSPDNTRLVYASYRPPDGWELIVIEIETGTETILTNFQGQARFPKWSPVQGDDRIVFEGRSGNLGSYDYNLWIVHAGDGNLEQITTSNADSRPRWKPDGTQIVFERATRDTTRDGRIATDDFSDMYILDLSTGKVTAVTNTPGNNDVQYAWSPDGRQIAFVSARQDITGDGHINLDDARNLYLITPTGSGEHSLDLGRVHAYTPDWAQSGEQIVYLVKVRSGRNELWVVDLDSGERRKVSDTGPYYHPEWARQNLVLSPSP